MMSSARPLYSDAVTDYMTGFIDHYIGGASSFQTNYNVTLFVYRGYGVNSGNTVYIPSSELRPDYNDIRFVDDKGRLLPYWICSSTSTYAMISVMLYEIPTTGVVIRVLYGGNTLPAGQNGAACFPTFFDDFLGAALDGAKWSTSGNSQTVANSQVTVTYNGGMSKLATQSTWAAGYCAMYSASLTIGYKTMVAWTAMNGGTLAGLYAHYPVNNHYSAVADSDGNFTSYSSTDLGTTYTGTHVWEMARRATTTAQLWIDGVSVSTLTTYAPVSALPIRFLAQDSGSSIVCDWIGIRKHVNPEPAHGWWGWLEDL